MSGRFRYRSTTLNIVCLLAVLAVLMNEQVYRRFEVMSFLMPFIGVAVIILSRYVPCRFTADEKGVTFLTGLKKTRILFDEVMYADITTRQTPYTKAGYSFENVLTVRTYGKEYRFREDCGTMELGDLLHRSERVQSQFIDTDLGRLTEYIKERI